MESTGRSARGGAQDFSDGDPRKILTMSGKGPKWVM